MSKVAKNAKPTKPAKAVKVVKVVATEDTAVRLTVNPDNYVQTTSASGKKSMRRDDEVANAMDGLPIESIHALGQKLLKEDTSAKYQHLNVGMQRMNVGNRLRKFVKEAAEGEDRAGSLADAAAPLHARAEKVRDVEAKRKASEVKAADAARAAKAKTKTKKAA